MNSVLRKAYMAGYTRQMNWGEFERANPHEERTAIRKAFMAGYSRDYVWIEPNTWKPFPVSRA